MRNEFTAIVEQDGPWYIAYCAEVPGANGQGATREECLTSLRDAIALIAPPNRTPTVRSPEKIDFGFGPLTDSGKNGYGRAGGGSTEPKVALKNRPRSGLRGARAGRLWRVFGVFIASASISYAWTSWGSHASLNHCWMLCVKADHSASVPTFTSPRT